MTHFIHLWADVFYTAVALIALVVKIIIESTCAKLFTGAVALTLIAWAFGDVEVIGSLAGLSVALFAAIFVEHSENWRN